MTIKSAPYFWYECDWEDCGLSASEGGDYSAWSEEDGAMVEAENWTEIDKKFYCDEHWHWADDDSTEVAGPGA